MGMKSIDAANSINNLSMSYLNKLWLCFILCG